MRKAILFVGKATITAALLYFAIGRGNFTLLGERLGRLDPLLIAAALAAVAAQTLLLALRWRAIAASCGTVLPIALASRYMMISIFFSQVLPSTVGGDAVRVWLLARDGTKWSVAAYSILIDRLIGILGVAVTVVAGLPWSLSLIRNPVGRGALLLIGLGSIVAVLTFIILGSLRLVFLQRFWLGRQVMKFAVLLREVSLMSTIGTWALLLSIASIVLTCAVTWCVARAAAVPFEFTHSLLLIPPVLLISTVPISIAGWGVRETALIVAFGYAGLPESDALIVSLLFGATMLAFGIAGGGVWLASGADLRAVRMAPLPDKRAESER